MQMQCNLVASLVVPVTFSWQKKKNCTRRSFATFVLSHLFCFILQICRGGSSSFNSLLLDD